MKNQLKLGSILSYLQMGISVVVQLLYTPVMIHLLGQSEYGLYNTVASTISMLSILSLGFNSGYVRYYAKYKESNDRLSISKLNGLFIIIFSIIGIIGLICGLFLSQNLNIVFDNGLTIEEYKTARALMLLLTINLAVEFPMSVFQNIISAHEEFVFLKLIGMLRTILSPLITLPLLLVGFRSIAMVTVAVSVGISTNVIYLFHVAFKMKEKFIFYGFEKGIFMSLFSYTVFIAMNTVIDQINWNIDKLLLGRFKGTTEVAVYSVGFTLYNAYMLFSTSISGVFTPRIHAIVNSTTGDVAEQRKQLTDLFTRVGRIQFLILGLIAAGITFFGKYFVTDIWAGKGYDNSYYVALLLIIPASIALIQSLGIEIQRAENKHQFRSIVYLVMAFINLGLSIILCQKFGAVGSAIGTSISLIVANGIIMNVYYHKKCNIDMFYFWKSIVKQLLGFIPPVIYGIAFTMLFEINSIVFFAIGVLSYMLVYCVSVWIISMNEYEKNLIRAPLKRILRRNKE